MWILALQSVSFNRSFISSQDLLEVMDSVTSVHVKSLNFTLVSFALLSLVRSAAILMSMSQSFNLVESCSLKTGISCSKEFVSLDCSCVEHKVSVHCHITSLNIYISIYFLRVFIKMKRSPSMKELFPSITYL